MGYNGIGVSFAEASDGSRAAMFDEYATLVDDVIKSDVIIGLDQARRIQRIERARAYSEKVGEERARGLSGVARASALDMQHRAFVSEMAAALHVPERTAEATIWAAPTLVNDLPDTLLALCEGRLTLRHAQILVDNSCSMEPADLAALEAAVLLDAERMTAPQFERKVRTTRERLAPETMVDRVEKATDDRSVFKVVGRDGMGSLANELPIALVTAIDNRLTDIARSQQGPDEKRTLAQLKADAFCDILLDVDGQAGTTAGQGDGPTARYRSIRPRVLITVPVLTLLRQGDEPGILEGVGPIDPQTARQLTANAKSLYRLLVHPETGIVLSMGRKRYRIPQELRMWLRVRDGTCRFPGCNRQAMHCELDHTVDWDLDGHTAHENLANLCPGHHALKHTSGWSVEQLAGGVLRWTSPSGIVYETRPEVQMG